MIFCRSHKLCLLSILLALSCFLLTSHSSTAEDWPEWRGKGRRAEWNETGVIESFPSTGLIVKWRTPIRGGYDGPSVSNGKVFVTDYTPTDNPTVGTERALCLDEQTGKVLWSYEWPANYSTLSYNYGPRATPTVDGDRVYTLGSLGMLTCLDVNSGKVIWQRDYVKDFKTHMPIWGIAGAPIVHENLLIGLVGGENNAKVVAFDKMTGKEIWRALDSNSECGYVQPIIIDAGGAKQLIIWHPAALASLDPATGKVYWEQPFTIKMSAPLATPIHEGNRLFISAFYNGPMMMELDSKTPTAKMVWKGKSDNEIKTDGIHCCHASPVIFGDHIYGVCSYGQFRCLKADTGERVWESMAITIENQRWSSAVLVKRDKLFYISNDRGELMTGTLAPEGYKEISRTHLIKPTTPGAGKRELGGVAWAHPAFANKHIVMRNDEEIIRASLDLKDYPKQ